MKRLVWALHRAYSSLVSIHLVINNKISEWIRVVTDINGGDKMLPNRGAGSFDLVFFLFCFLQCNHTRAHTHTHSFTLSNMHTFKYTTVVKHEA